MTKPWYQKRKFWVAIVTAIGAAVAAYTKTPDLGVQITAIGIAVISGLGLEDFGKEREALSAQMTGGRGGMGGEGGPGGDGQRGQGGSGGVGGVGGPGGSAEGIAKAQ